MTPEQHAVIVAAERWHLAGLDVLERGIHGLEAMNDTARVLHNAVVRMRESEGQRLLPTELRAAPVRWGAVHQPPRTAVSGSSDAPTPACATCHDTGIVVTDAVTHAHALRACRDCNVRAGDSIPQVPTIGAGVTTTQTYRVEWRFVGADLWTFGATCDSLVKARQQRDAIQTTRIETRIIQVTSYESEVR